MTSAELSSVHEGAANDAGSGVGISADDFRKVALVVVRRLVLRKWLLGLLRTWRWVLGVLLVLGVLKMLVGGWWFDWPMVMGVLGGWMIGVGVWAWVGCPGEYAALAYWDEQAGRSEAFANAWWIESRGLSGVGDQLHWRQQSKGLVGVLAAGGIRKELLLPRVRGVLVVWGVAVAMIWLPDLSRIELMDFVLSREAKLVAGEEGRKLAERVLDERKMEGLTEKERQEVRELRNKVGETAQALQQEGAQSAREVLSELERRAREAEQMAERIGAGDAAWASEKMVAELRQHVDTAGLGDAVAVKSAEKTAQEAENLAKKMGDEQMAQEVKTRLTESFAEIAAEAEAEDGKRTVGQHVLAVDGHLGQGLMEAGAEEMRVLADKMRVLAQRERTREQLEKLAQQLRDAGSHIAGQGSQGGMQKLDGGQSQEGAQGQGASGQGQPMMAMPNAPSASPMQMPGGQSPQGQNMQGQGMQGQSVPMLTPSPDGAGQDGKSVAVMPAPDGKLPKDGKKDGPMLFAPIPGKPPSEPPDAVILMEGGPSGSRGGLDAGQGSSELKSEGGNKGAAGQTGLVDAQRNAEGLSSVRTVEGQVRQEAVTRGVEEVVLEAIAAEESALEDAALPAARREQVRRYFQELRQRFEGAER